MTEQTHEKIARLEKRLERERNARKQAEEQLEKKSQEIFESSQILQQRVDESEQKQAQLEYLTSISADTWHATSIDALLKQFVKRSGDFLNHSQHAYVLLDKQDPSVPVIKSILCEHDQTEQFISDLNIATVVSLLTDAEFESQLFELSAISNSDQAKGHCFIVPILNVKHTIGLACFYYESDADLNIFKLQTVESARVSLTVAIQQKLTAVKLQQKYKQLKQTYEQLHQTQQQLVQSEKMASLGQMAAGVAHEINNPIGFVLSNYQTLVEYMKVLDQLLCHNQTMLQHSEKTPELTLINELWQQEDVDFIREDLSDLLSSSQGGLKRVQEIVAGLKSFSHSDTTNFKPVYLDECINEAINLVWNELKYDCQLEKHLASSNPILGKNGQLQQVFVNMLVNAKQAMPDGGTIRVRSMQKEEHILVEIEDTGCGIAPENLEKLFTPFFTTKEVGVGTGLGLSISYGILQEHNADVTVRSVLNQGTCFTMTFPNTNEVN